MIRQSVQSSQIKSIAHDARTNTLEVEFMSGHLRHYHEVNVDEFKALMAAESIGSHFSNNIKSVKTSAPVERQ